MKQVAVGCLTGLAGWLGVALALSWLLQTRYEYRWPETLSVSIVAGLAGWTALALLRAALQRWNERKSIARSVAGLPPRPGAGAALVGTIEPLGSTLRAPLDGAECVAYHYAITEDRGSGRRRTVATHFKGVALAPSVIRTRAGPYKLLTVPELEGTSPVASHDRRTASFERYARATTFSGADTSAQELVDRWTDPDGSYRSDVAYSALDAVKLSNCQLEQQHIRPGARVSAFGSFSAAKGGLVPTGMIGANPRLVEGSVNEVLAKLASSARTRLLLAVLAASACAGLMAAFVGHA